jgi:hypothetical protein
VLSLTDIQIELNGRGGVEATGIRLTREEFQSLKASRRRPADPLIQAERDGKPAQVIGMAVTWVEAPVRPMLLPATKRR